MFSDKYFPTNIDQFRFNVDAVHKINSLSKLENIPHMIIKGNDGCGKKTLALHYIIQKYGLKSIDQINVVNQIYKIGRAHV